MKINFEADKIFIASQAVDFRKQVDGLCALVMEIFAEKPHAGVFVFYNGVLWKNCQKGVFRVGI